jgi:hypothetical protein
LNWASLRGFIWKKGHGQLKNKQTGKILSKAESLALLQPHLSVLQKTKSVEAIAEECGLQKLYDLPFRFSSLAVHGNTFGLYADGATEAWALSCLPAIIAFVKATALIADNYPDRNTTAAEILGILRLDKIPGK